MSDTLGDVEDRLAATHQLDAVIRAMRGLAAARVSEAHEGLRAIRASAATVGAAIGEILAVAPVLPARDAGGAARGSGAEMRIVVGTEQGFVAGFNERIAAAASGRDSARALHWLLVGSRLRSALAGRGVSAAWSAPMAAHPDEIPRLASRVTDALFARLSDGADTARVVLFHASPGAPDLRIAQHALMPFDFARFQVQPHAQSPLLNVAPARLLAGMVESYVYVELCEVLMLSFAAEN